MDNVDGVSNDGDDKKAVDSSNAWIQAELEKIHGGKDLNKYNIKDTAYSMIVIELMDQVGMGPIEKTMSAEADLENILAKIQGDLVSLSSFLSKIENNSNSTTQINCHCYDDQTPALATNSFNGIDPSLYNDPAFKAEIQSFVGEFKQLFYSNNGNTGMTLGDISSITGANGQTFNLTDYWNQLANEYKANDTNPPSFSYQDASGQHSLLDSMGNGGQASDHVSLFQIYVYCKLKLQVLEKGNISPDTDMMKIFNPDPSASAQGSDDGVCSMLVQFLQSFNQNVQVERTDDWTPSESTTAGINGLGILGLIMNDQMDDFSGSNGTPSGWQGKVPGLMTAFSYMAFNYFWTKNPDYSGSNNLYPGEIPSGTSLDSRTSNGVPHGDLLSDTYASSTNVQSLVGSNSQEQTTDMQEKTTVMGQFDNIGQNIITQNSQAQNNTVQNFKNA